MRALQQEGLMAPLRGVSADQYTPIDLHLQFPRFSDWARRNASLLQGWIALHFTAEIREQHFLAIRHDVAQSVNGFWIAHAEDISRLTDQTGLSSERLRYAFDIMYRGLLYSDMTQGRRYFPHPIRDPLMPPSESTTAHLHSWGRALLRGLRDHHVPKDAGLIAATISTLQRLAHFPGRPSTWNPLRGVSTRGP